MSTVRTQAKKKPDEAPREPAAGLAIPVGERLLEVLDVAYRARRPVLLEGPTGIGKSQVAAEFAASVGIRFAVLDLSLLEPPDLVGLPVIRDGRTHYASPAELPTEGDGVLMLEELNRAEVPVMQPALQLLSARRLHAYELPPGWMCVAAVNPEDGDYQVNRLDPALRSRFMQLRVCADRDAWLRWARRRNVHPTVLAVVRDHADAFEGASPRSWAYVSDVLHVLRPEEAARADLVAAALRGYLPSPWALLVAGSLARQDAAPPVDVGALLGPGGDRALASLVQGLVAKGRVDAVATVASRLRAALAGERAVEAASRGELTMAQLERLAAPLPGDLREQCLETAAESPAGEALLGGLGVDATAVVERGYEASGARNQVLAWHHGLLLHRVRLAASATLRALGRLDEGAVAALARDERRRRELGLLADDAGPLGLDLARWLRARMPAAAAR